MLAGKRRMPQRGPVALARMGENPAEDLAQAIARSDGFSGLGPSDRVLIKPNLVGLSKRFETPPYGVVSTTLMIEALLAAVRDHGCGSVAIGDGGLENGDSGTDTVGTMEALGLPALARRFDARLIDLNRGPFADIIAGGIRLKAAVPALEADFLISLPVLKTHCQTVVSLALKNMKGCLHMRSRMACHDADGGLFRNVARQAAALYPDLAVIDGRYALARGPLHFGKAVRSDLLVVARDALDADLVGTALLGYTPGQVPHLSEICRLLGRASQAPEPDGGVDLAEATLDLPWDFPWADSQTPESFKRMGVRNFMLPKYDDSLCTGCSFLYSPAMVMIADAARKKPDLGGVELLTGKNTRPSGQAAVSVLLGNCIIKAQRGDKAIKKAVPVPGCPAELEQLAAGLRQAGVPASVEAVEAHMERLRASYTAEGGFLPSDFAPGAD